jgi:hypothetical protein
MADHNLCNLMVMKFGKMDTSQDLDMEVVLI